MLEKDNSNEAIQSAMDGRAKMNKYLRSLGEIKEADYKERMSKPYSPFSCQEEYDLAVKAGWPNNLNWIYRAVELMGKKPKRPEVDLSEEPQELIKF